MSVDELKKMGYIGYEMDLRSSDVIQSDNALVRIAWLADWCPEDLVFLESKTERRVQIKNPLWMPVAKRMWADRKKEIR